MAIKDMRDLSHVLFALRYLQANLDADTADDLASSEIVGGEGHEPMNDEEIDDLCERLNCDEGKTFKEDECPYCQSDEIQAGDFDLESHFRPHACCSCKATWKVIYHATEAYEVVPDGKN